MDKSHQQSPAISSNQTSPSDSKCYSSGYNPNVVPCLYFVLFSIALLPNSVAAWVSLHLKSTSTFVVYLKNLVAADVLMTLIIPIKAASDLEDASNTLFILACRYFSVIFYSTLYTCIAFLGLIGLDRFFKIVMPHSKLSGQNLTFSKVASVLVWVTIFGGTGLPNIILTNNSAVNVTKLNTCMQLKGPAGLKFHENAIIYLNVFFILVSVVVAVCYICITNKVIQSFRNSGSNNNQGNQKVKLRVFLVMIVFFVSFGPYHIVRIPYTSLQVNSSPHNCSYVVGKFAKDLSLWLATTNICMDPLLYVFLCREFKEKLMSMVEKVSISLKAASGNKVGDSSPQCKL